MLLVGSRSFDNMWDELIVLWNIKLLQNQWKEIFVVSQNPDNLRDFISQFVDVSKITFIKELPWWIRSFFRAIKNWEYKNLKYFLGIDTIILWWWEIFTEEMKSSYYYRFNSIWPAFFFRKNLIIMWWVQVPKKWFNRLLFKYTTHYTKAILCRDFEEIEPLSEFWAKNVSFFMDTSYFAIDDWKKYKHKSDEKYIVINLTTRGLNFMDDLIKVCKDYLSRWYKVYFVPVCSGKGDGDAYLYDKMQNILKSDKFEMLYWRDDFENFLNVLWWAEKIFSVRLHLFLISEFIGLDTTVYPYQKKIIKMQKVIDKVL